MDPIPSQKYCKMRNISQLWSQRDRITEEGSERRDNDDFEMEEGGHKPRDVGCSVSFEREGNDFSPNTSRRNTALLTS